MSLGGRNPDSAPASEESSSSSFAADSAAERIRCWGVSDLDETNAGGSTRSANTAAFCITTRPSSLRNFPRCNSLRVGTRGLRITVDKEEEAGMGNEAGGEEDQGERSGGVEAARGGAGEVAGVAIDACSLR